MFIRPLSPLSQDIARGRSSSWLRSQMLHSLHTAALLVEQAMESPTRERRIVMLRHADTYVGFAIQYRNMLVMALFRE